MMTGGGMRQVAVASELSAGLGINKRIEFKPIEEYISLRGDTIRVIETSKGANGETYSHITRSAPLPGTEEFQLQQPGTKVPFQKIVDRWQALTPEQQASCEICPELLAETIHDLLVGKPYQG